MRHGHVLALDQGTTSNRVPAAVNDASMQFQADVLGVRVQRMGCGCGVQDVRRNGARDREFAPRLEPPERAVARAREWEDR